MTHFGVASVNRALVSLKEKNYISWISGRNSKKGGAVSNKYTLYLSGTPSQSDIPLSQSDIPPLSEREGQSITVIYPLSHSDRQKRIEKETNTNLTKEMAGLVGKSFLEAAKPQAPNRGSVFSLRSRLVPRPASRPGKGGVLVARFRGAAPASP